MASEEIYQTQKVANLQAYEQVKHQIRRLYSGQYVVIAQGKILLSAPTYQEAWEHTKHIAPDARHFLIFPANRAPLLETVKVRNHGKIYLGCD